MEFPRISPGKQAGQGELYLFPLPQDNGADLFDAITAMNVCQFSLREPSSLITPIGPVNILTTKTVELKPGAKPGGKP